MIALIVCGVAGRAAAEPSDDEVSARLRFLDERLQTGATTTRGWHWGWTSFYGVGLAVQTGRAIAADGDAERADLVISAIKAFLGTAGRLARPPHAIHANRALRHLPERTATERAHKLSVAEELLARNARECDARFSWIAHSLNAILNIGGGLIVWLGYDDLPRAAQSTAIGLAVGELAIWTQPTQPKRDWQEYRARFGLERAPSPSLSIAPLAAPNAVGGSVAVRF